MLKIDQDIESAQAFSGTRKQYKASFFSLVECKLKTLELQHGA